VLLHLEADPPGNQQRYGVVGPPTVMFLDANGNELRDLRLVGYERAAEFLTRLKKIR